MKKKQGVNIIACGLYLPKQKVTNEVLEKKLNLPSDFIFSRTGIKERYYTIEETVEEMAIKAVENLKEKVMNKIDFEKIEMILVATTSPNYIMPGISFQIQAKLGIQNCICMDFLAGCAGFINAFDVAHCYMVAGKIQNALIIGVDQLSKYTDSEDINTKVLLSDGAGVVYIEKSEQEKLYASRIESNGERGAILTCKTKEFISMDGKKIYQYAVTDTVKNAGELLKEAEITIEEIDYFIPHQSNLKMIKSISNRLSILMEKVYTNLEQVGNTFCASIPIALCEMQDKGLLKKNQKILLLGYGGGLNTGSILLEL